jgi:hypothetical protein
MECNPNTFDEPVPAKLAATRRYKGARQNHAKPKPPSDFRSAIPVLRRLKKSSNYYEKNRSME